MMKPLVLALALLSLPALAAPPRLTVVIAVDSLGAELLQRHIDQMPQGIGQLRAQGAYFPLTSYEYATPVTGPGHATLSTGANPWRHGIVANYVFDRGTGRSVSVFADPERPLLEAPPSSGDASPKALLAETLADRVRFSTRERGKVIAITGKPRSAIALAGRLGQAWWFHDGVGKFVTSTFYAKEFPTWVKALNAKKLPDTHFGKSWTLARAQKDYLGEDDRPFEADYRGLGRTFPHPLTGGSTAPGPEFYAALATSPVGSDLIVEACKAAIEGEGLGKDAVPDVLFVGFSAPDRIYHLFGPNSWETQDSLFRLDGQIAAVLAAAERAAGKGNVLVALTADHGGAAVPEEWSSAGLPALRLHPNTLVEGLNKELKARFGVGPLVVGVEEVNVYLSTRALAEKKLDAAQVRRAAAEWLRARPEVALAFPAEELASPRPLTGVAEMLRLNYHPERSGDVLYALKPFIVLTEETTGTNHGVPYAYDRDVPLLLRGPGVKKGRFTTPVHPTDLAPTLGLLLGVGVPSQAEGRVLHEALTP